MNTTKIVAGICIFSTLFMGCSSSMLIDPAGADKDKIQSGGIEYVVTKDSTMHKFYWPARADSCTVVGVVLTQVGGESSPVQVWIPLSDIQWVYVRQFDASTTLIVFGSIIAGLALGTALLLAAASHIDMSSN
jgi:hypothetical protein